MKKKFIFLASIICLCFLAVPSQANAKAKLQMLKKGKTYKFDVNNDGKKKIKSG